MITKDKKKEKNLSTFLLTLFFSIKIYIAFFRICSDQYSEKEIRSYFTNLIRTRVNEFIEAHRKKHPQKEKWLFFHPI